MLTFGEGVKCEHTLACIVGLIDGQQRRSKTLTMYMYMYLTMYRVHTAVRLWGSNFGKFSRSGKNSLQSNDIR